MPAFTSIETKKKLDFFGRELGIVLNQVSTLYKKLQQAGIQIENERHNDDVDENDGIEPLEEESSD